MGSTAAVICKGKRDSTRFLLKMLSVMSHRGSEAYGIATDNALEVKGDLKKLTVTESNVSIGYNFSKILPWDKPQPVSFNNVKLTFHGRVFPNKEMSESDLILGLFEREPVKEAELILEKLNGAYSFAALIDGKLIVGRDPLGLKPLYYGENHEVYAFATEKKALWSIGIKNVKSFPPGFIGQISNGRLSLKPIKVLKKPKTESISADKCIRHLKKLLYSSISDRIYGLKKVALAFSGGLDSSILAAIMKELGVDVQLIAVGSEGSHDYSWALEIAEEIGLPADLKIFKADDVRDVLPIVLWLIEDPNPLSLSIAVPFYFVAEESSNLRLNVLFSGQGGDELFGGYKKYVDIYKSLGREALENEIFVDVKMSYEKNFERDEKVCAYHKVELRLPYADWSLINYSLRIPVSLKVLSPHDQLRKRILRKLAEALGLPRCVYEGKKRAVQYSAGIMKILRKIAKEEKSTLKDYIRREWIKLELKA